MDSVNSRSSLGQAGEYSAANCSDGEQCAQLNVMPTQHKFWRNDKTMEFSNLSRFGLTLNLLTESRGEELLTSYLEGFPVRTLALPEREQESQENVADCGSTSNGLLAKYDLTSCSWKTAQRSLFVDLELSLEIWPRSGSMRNGECYPQPMLVRSIYEKESGFWPTIRARDAERGGRGDLIQAVRGNQSKHFKFWPTPAASDANKWSNQSLKERKEKGQQVRLNTAVSPEGGNGGQLNPTWVEWLMGWPLGWTDLKQSVTAKFHYAPQQHFVCSQKEPAYE
jgi:hypothetical protein